MFVVCGEALYDLFSPESGDPRHFSVDAHAGGSPFNVAVGLARQQQQAALLTGVSTDFLGQQLVRVLKSEGVVTRYLIHNERRTTLSLVGMAPDGQPDYAFYGIGSSDCGVQVADLPKLDDDVRGLHFGSYSLAVEPAASAFAHLATRELKPGRLASLDPNIRPTIEPDMAIWRARVEALVPQMNLIKASDDDLRHMYGPEVDFDVIADEWLTAGAQMVIVTRGSGAVIAYQRTRRMKINPPPIMVVDTVGAGDTFQATLLTQLLEHGLTDLAGLDETTAQALVTRSAMAAALTCTRLGADLPTKAEIDAFRGV